MPSKSRLAIPKAIGFDPTEVVRYRLTNCQLFASSAGTALSVLVTCDPSAYTEYADISALFSEIRLVSSTIHIANVLNTTTVNRYNLPIGFDPSNTSTSPVSQVAVYAIAGARFNPISSPEVHTYRARITQMAWALVTAPVPGPYAGCFGAWSGYRSALDVSTSYCDVYSENVYELRGRR